jgi:hypothetical protein
MVYVLKSQCYLQQQGLQNYVKKKQTNSPLRHIDSPIRPIVVFFSESRFEIGFVFFNTIKLNNL